MDAVYLGQQAEAGSEAEKKVQSLQAQMKEVIKADPKIATLSKEIQMEKGKQVYMQTCFVCHQIMGEGIAGQIPPLGKSDYLMADKDRSIRAVLHGMTGEVIVNGKKFNGVMIPHNHLPDDQIANVLTYVRNSWGNSGDNVTVEQVRRIRAEAPASAAKSNEFE